MHFAQRKRYTFSARTDIETSIFRIRNNTRTENNTTEQEFDFRKESQALQKLRLAMKNENLSAIKKSRHLRSDRILAQ